MNKEQVTFSLSLLFVFFGIFYYLYELEAVPEVTPLVREGDFIPQGRVTETEVLKLVPEKGSLSPLWKPAAGFRDPWKEAEFWRVPRLKPLDPPKLDLPRSLLFPPPLGEKGWIERGEK